MNKILIVEDKKSMADMLSMAFGSEGYEVKCALSIKDGLASLDNENVDAVVTDLKLPDGSGFDILKSAKERVPSLPVVVMTAFGSIETAVRAVKEGAYDFITKPFDPDHLLLIIKRALSERFAAQENLALKKEFSDFLRIPDMAGTSKAWMDVLEKAKKVAQQKTTVLILGESGTGKELVARTVHFTSPRADKPFVPVNCPAIPKDLIENELFGHEKGAFTGATEAKAGRFELANNGTIFLDEIGDMDMNLQSKLLRVLQEGEFERVGGTKSIKVDIRVIAASNKNLEQEVAQGRFREDLFYRLNVFPVNVPPLRGRRDDIIPLTRHFVKLFCNEMRKPIPGIPEEVEALLLEHEWKGNVRELKNAMERAVILCDGNSILPEHFGLAAPHKDGSLIDDDSLFAASGQAVRVAEKARIEDALRTTGGNKSKAAVLLKVSYKTLLNKIKEYGIG
ncbi:MAG: sigma-54-dependent Fis family transcriptional regulator [Nitrospirae bacterium]|nr:MAG: sigma-54-dependent Fis family transcriptional regulator [Nitrospirota bacterium]